MMKKSAENDVYEVNEETGGNFMESGKVRSYSLKDRIKISRENIRVFEQVHRRFAGIVSDPIKQMLNCHVQLELDSVKLMRGKDFTESLPVPLDAAIINMDPLKGKALYAMDQAVTFAVLDRSFGGAGEAAAVSRDLTDIELGIMEGFYVRCLGALREAWSNIIDLRPRLVDVEPVSRGLDFMPGNAYAAVCTFSIKVNNVQGITRLCIPCETIECIRHKFTESCMYSNIRDGEREEYSGHIEKSTGVSFYKVIHTFTGAVQEMTPAAIRKLRRGDVIPLSSSCIGRTGYEYGCSARERINDN